MPWQQDLIDAVAKCIEEGRTEPRYVQTRRGGYWTFVKPANTDR